jgi:hypothetical protein
MKWLVPVSVAVLCLSASVGILWVCHSTSVLLTSANQTIQQLPDRLERESAKYRYIASGLTWVAVVKADHRLRDAIQVADASRKNLDSQLTAFRRDTNGQLTAFNQLVCNMRFDLQPVLKATANSITKIGNVADTTNQAIAQVNDALPMFLDCDHNPDCLFNRWVTVSRAIQTSARTFDEKFPHIVLAVERIGDNSDKTTEATAKFMGNLERSTRPFPKWVRIVAGIAPPVAQTAAAGMGIAVAVGAFR